MTIHGITKVDPSTPGPHSSPAARPEEVMGAEQGDTFQASADLQEEQGQIGSDDGSNKGEP